MWSPVFCCDTHHKGYCGNHHRNRLVLHGLWPEYYTGHAREQQRGWPQYCDEKFKACYNSTSGRDMFLASCQLDRPPCPRSGRSFAGHGARLSRFYHWRSRMDQLRHVQWTDATRVPARGHSCHAPSPRRWQGRDLVANTGWKQRTTVRLGTAIPLSQCHSL